MVFGDKLDPKAAKAFKLGAAGLIMVGIIFFFVIPEAEEKRQEGIADDLGTSNPSIFQQATMEVDGNVAGWDTFLQWSVGIYILIGGAIAMVITYRFGSK